MTEPITLNGYLYDRESIEEWLLEYDWKDPFVSEGENFTATKYVSPDDLIECEPIFIHIHSQFEQFLKQ